MDFDFEINGKRERVRVIESENNKISIEYKDSTYKDVKIFKIDEQTHLAIINNRPVEFIVRNNDNASIFLTIDNREYFIEKIDNLKYIKNRKSIFEQDGIYELRANMPGKIVKILKSENEMIKMGEGILVIEAMKMENELKSPRDGIIKKIAVREHQSIETGMLLAIIE